MNLHEFPGHLYTALDDAVSRVTTLVDSFSTPSLPGVERGTKYAVFARQVASPSHEVLRFLKLARRYGLVPLFLEFHADKFVTRNSCKFGLVRMSFADEPTVKDVECQLTVADIQINQGRALGCVTTFWGERLVDFHRTILVEQIGHDELPLFVDGSEWFEERGASPADYYHHFLAAFLSNCILFETYLMDERECGFTREVVLPAFERVKSTHGRHPLVVRLDPAGMEGDKFWVSYPMSVSKSVIQRMDASHHL